MPSREDARALHRRRLTVDVLIGAATLAVGLATVNSAGNGPYLLLLASALAGIGLILEPNVTAQSAGNIDPQPLRPPTEPEPPEPQQVEPFDAAIAEATSV